MYYPSVQRMMLNKGLSEAEINSYIQICAMIGKFGIAGSFALIYNYTAELYPAVVRFDHEYFFQNIKSVSFSRPKSLSTNRVKINKSVK